MSGRFWAFLILFAGLISSCASYRNSTPPVIENITGLTFGKLENGKVDLSFVTQIKNPDLLKFRIKRARLDVMMGETKIAEINSTRVIKIKRQLKPEVEWNVTADLKDILRKPAALFGGLLKGKIELRIVGEITVAKCFISRKIPVDFKKPVQLPYFKF